MLDDPEVGEVWGIFQPFLRFYNQNAQNSQSWWQEFLFQPFLRFYVKGKRSYYVVVNEGHFQPFLRFYCAPHPWDAVCNPYNFQPFLRFYLTQITRRKGAQL